MQKKLPLLWFVRVTCPLKIFYWTFLNFKYLCLLCSRFKFLHSRLNFFYASYIFHLNVNHLFSTFIFLNLFKFYAISPEFMQFIFHITMINNTSFYFYLFNMKKIMWKMRVKKNKKIVKSFRSQIWLVTHMHVIISI